MKLVDLIRKRYDADVVRTIATQGVMLGAALITSVITARALGPEGRGTFFFVTTTAALVAQFGNLGLVTTNTLIAARRRDVVGALTANALWLALAIVLAVAAAVAVVGDLVPTSNGYLFFAAVIGGARLFQLLSVNLLVAIERFDSFSRFQILASAILVGAMLLAAIRPTVDAFLWATALAVLGAGFLIARHLGAISPIPWRYDLSLYADHLRFSFKSYLILILTFLVQRGNVFLIEGLSSREEIGYYSIATQIGEAMGLLAASMALVLYPRLLRQAAGRFRYMLGYLVVIGVTLGALCLLTALAARPAIVVAFGIEFAPALGPTLWLLPGVLFVGMHAIVAQYLAAEGQPAAILASWLLAVAVMVWLGLVQIPERGSIGAALSLSAAYLVLLVANLTLAGVIAFRRRGVVQPGESSGI